MAFIEKVDLERFIQQDELTFITQDDDSFIADAVDSTVASMKSYLADKYNVSEIFAQTGADRNAEVKDHAINITLFKLHTSIQSDEVPQKRLFFYQAAYGWLEKVASGEGIKPDLPLLTDADGEDITNRYSNGAESAIDGHGY